MSKKTNYKYLYEKYKKFNIKLHNRVYILELEFENLLEIKPVKEVIDKHELDINENLKKLKEKYERDTITI